MPDRISALPLLQLASPTVTPHKDGIILNNVLAGEILIQTLWNAGQVGALPPQRTPNWFWEFCQTPTSTF